MKDKLMRIAPLGINLKLELVFFIGLLVLGILNSSSVLMKYAYELQALNEIGFTGSLYLPYYDTVMPPFQIFIEGSYHCFLIAMICMPGVVAYHYFYHYQEYKSIYLMKRLPKKNELHKRCWGLPIVGSLVILITAVFLYALYYAVYLLVTPPEYLMIR